MCEITAKILNAKIHGDLSNDQIAERMHSHLKTKDVSHDMVQKYFSGNSGVPLESVGALLLALGLTVVSKDSVVISQDKLKALMLLAQDSLARDLENYR